MAKSISNLQAVIYGSALGLAVAAFIGRNKENSAIGARLSKQVVYQYILDSIDSSEYGVDTPTDKEKLQFLFDMFKNEQGYNIGRMGLHGAFMEWIQGLPSSFNIDFNNYDILQLAKKWGSLPANATERQEDKILANYWNLITVNTFQLFRKFGIKTY